MLRAGFALHQAPVAALQTFITPIADMFHVVQKFEGWAWAGAGIAQAEVSVNGGSSRQVARLERRVDFAWQGFSLEASLPAGEQHLLCRAVANDGAIQPARGARDEWFGIRIEAAASATQAKG